MGLNQAAAACRDARAAGLAPAEVHALAGHWRSRREAWGEHTHALLPRRLTRTAPGEDPTRGWPAYAAGASTFAAERADRLLGDRRRELLADANRAVARLSEVQRRLLGAEARRRSPELAVAGVDGRRVFEEGVAPLPAEWGPEGLVRWLESVAA